MRDNTTSPSKTQVLLLRIGGDEAQKKDKRKGRGFASQALVLFVKFLKGLQGKNEVL